MASAKFLEEALSTDVDESAVNAIVGSLETQLVTSTPGVSSHQAITGSVSQQNHQLNSPISNGGTIPTTVQKHGVANGGSTTSKTITTSTLVPVNVVTSQVVVSSQQLNQQQSSGVTVSGIGTGSGGGGGGGGGSSNSGSGSNTTVSSGTVTVASASASASAQACIPATAFINQINANQVSGTQTSVPKTHEPVKLIYPSTGQVISTSGVGVVNVNNKITFPTQTVNQLANGAIAGVTNQQQQQTQSPPVLQTASNANVANVVAGSTNVGSIVTQTSGHTVANVNKSAGTALVIKTSGTPGGMVSVPMSVPVSVAGNIAITTLQGKTGVTSTIVPSNVQILNVNAVRPGTPVGPGQQPGKQVTSRVVLGPHVIGSRPGAPGGFTIHGFQPGTQGHLIVKTENGQYQLLRVGPAPTAAAAPTGTAVTSNSIGGNANMVAPTAGTTYRLASMPATVAANVSTTTTVTQNALTTAATTTSTPSTPSGQTTPQCVSRQNADNTKEKCRKFLANLLELSSREPKTVERNVRTLIQELIDAKVEPEEFCDRLEKLLNASPQPCLIGFLKKSLPLLRQSLVTKELVIDGIRPPPANVVFCIASSTPTVQQNQIRPTVAGLTSVPVVVSSQQQTPVRVMAPPSAISTPIATPRAPQPVPQRLVRPGATIVRSPLAQTIKSTVALTGVRQTTPAIQKSTALSSNVVKTVTYTTQGKTVNVAPSVNKTIVPSLVTKPTAKEKEKKSFSSAGYTGDDDINDVAAMGGVNLAEESQRILGSTEFVGTQIRSCKDEIFLHATPLQQRIGQIVSSYGLEEPNHEVAALISHATQERLKNLLEKLAVIAEHRIDFIKVDPRYEVTQDVRAQLKFLEELDRVERRRHEEQEREILLKAAKSRAKTEDPEQAKLKAKAKEMQRAEMEELRQREANLTALQAIGPRKKPKLDPSGTSSNPGNGSNLNASVSGMNRQLPLRPRLKRVNFRDLLFLLEQEKETCRSTMLYKAYLK